MLNVWILLVAASSAVSVSAVSTYRRELSHGEYLTLDLPERTERLEFSTADEKDHLTIWQQKGFSLNKASKGTVQTAGNGWTFRIRHVTFDDEGTYTLLNVWNNVISTYTVKVKTKRGIMDRIPGETLYIPLEGIKQVDATLRFHNNYSVVTLVENGVPVGKAHPDYLYRLTVTSDYIQVLNVNVSDLGRYELTDNKGRLVSNNTMILVDRHDHTPNKGLLALLLLGIPGSICFCCRKRICKCCYSSKSQASSPTLESQPVSHPVTDPSQGYMAGYPTPPDQGQIHYPPPDPGQIHYPAPPQWNGQPAVPPNPGFHAPQDPVYAPEFGPGAQPPPWNAPPNQYSPSVPMNYNPMMNSAPSGPEPAGLKMNELSPAAPLLNPQPELSGPRVSTDVLNFSDTAVQFDVNKGKSSTNFL